MITANDLICGKKIQLIVIKIMSLGYMSIRATVIAVLVALLGLLLFGVYYHDAYTDKAKDLEAAERQQKQAETIAGNVIQSMRIFNAITQANHDEKQQI
ncbi:hypothetical protein [Symbiopectobacterium sp. RP]|uniref:hypothetical protein n=1 Tax=Symbiopectobacterium sp. RP TaxID=3248553 RepID=UPI003D2E1D40